MMILLKLHRRRAYWSLKKVPVVGIVDSNSDPDMIDYPIPMNDDASKALEYVLNLFKEAVLAGKPKSK